MVNDRREESGSGNSVIVILIHKEKLFTVLIVNVAREDEIDALFCFSLFYCSIEEEVTVLWLVETKLLCFTDQKTFLVSHQRLSQIMNNH